MDIIKLLHLRLTRLESQLTVMCKHLTTEECLLQVDTNHSPIKWHLGHMYWLWEQVLRYIGSHKVYNEGYSYLFNSYYPTSDEALPISRRSFAQPSMESVQAYRHHIVTLVEELLDYGDKEYLDPASLSLMFYALNHAEQHFELMVSSIKYSSYRSLLAKPYDQSYNSPENCESIRWIDVFADRIFDLGTDKLGSSFCYDCETPGYRYYQNNFMIRETVVTNGEYLRFVEREGYQNRTYWTNAGWDWKTSNNINHPLYWYKERNNWYEYDLGGAQKLKHFGLLNHISLYEAEAYAKYAEARLPTEQEWEIAAKTLGDKFQWGELWEWTSSRFTSYPGYKSPQEDPLHTSMWPLMDGRAVLRGASIHTLEDHSRISYRNYYKPDYRLQFAGIRLANDLD